MFNFYLVKNAFADGDMWLPKEYRILCLPKSFPFQFRNLPAYNSIRELRKNDPSWKEYNNRDPKSAQKICEERFIFKAKDFVLTPSGSAFDGCSYKVLKHGIMGELSKDINGIHLISALNKDITSISQLSAEDKNGVWNGIVGYYSEKRNKTYTKFSSFFPKSWTESQYMFEVNFAYQNLSEVDGEQYMFSSVTKSGVPVIFIIRDQKVRTVYPIYTNP